MGATSPFTRQGYLACNLPRNADVIINNQRTDTLFVVGLVLMGTALRIYRISSQSLWHDELFSWYTATLPALSDVIRIGALEDVHPPGYPLILRLWTQLFGTSETALRSLSSGAGVASLLLFYQLGCQVASVSVGRRMLLIATVAWMPIEYSQEARPYALLLMMVLAMCVAITRPSSRIQDGVFVGLLAIITSYLHYFGLLFVVLCLPAWGVALRIHQRSITPALLATSLVSVGYLPWITALRSQVHRAEVWIPPVDAARISGVLSSLLQGYPGLFTLLVLCGFLLSNRKKQMGAALFGFSAILGASVLISWVALPVLTDRNLIITLPLLFLLLAMSVESLDQQLGLPLATTFLVLSLLVDLFGVRAYYSTPTKPDYRGMVAWITTHRQPDSLVLVGVWDRAYVDYYAPDQSTEIFSTSTRKKARRRAFRAHPSHVLIASPLPLRRTQRCRQRQAGYHTTCVERPGWDLYEYHLD